MITPEQLEREIRACYGRYYEDTNSYEQISEEPNVTRCVYCCNYIEEHEVIYKDNDGDSMCEKCHEIYLEEKEDNLSILRDFDILEESIEEMTRLIDKHNENIQQKSLSIAG